MKNKVIIWDAEFVEVAPRLQIEAVDTSSFDDGIFAQMDWEIDSVMREIEAR